MLMPLKLEPPPPDPVAPSGLTQADIEALHQRINEFVDQLVAAERERMPGMPAVALRKLLLCEQCLCTAARRLLEQKT
jgi:hypothetical protein